MRSHEYEYKPKELLRILGMPLVPIAVFAALMHGGATLKVLPAPRPTLDVDRTILIHQAEASIAPSQAEVLLIGDSSCLIDASAFQLAQLLDRPALNLGTLSFLGLEDYAQLLLRFAAANPGRVKTVVLLMHPEALRRAPGGTYHSRFLRNFMAGQDHLGPVTGHLSNFLGLEKFRGRLFARVVPSPFPGAYGKRFGFTRELDNFLDENRGSAIELERRKFEGNPEYRLGADLEDASRVFRAAVPAGAILAVGITPAPAGHVQSGHMERYQSMLVQWGQWLQADVVLSNLPPTMEDENFATKTHLTEAGTGIYTKLLAKELR